MKKIFGICIVFAIIMTLYFDWGIPKSQVENEARCSQAVEQGWKVCKMSGVNVIGMLFYPADCTDCKYSIYMKNNKTVGFIYKGGGSMVSLNENIIEFQSEFCDEKVYMSMNRQQICKVEISKKNDYQTIEIDSRNPFVFVVPNEYKVKFYDVNSHLFESICSNL